MISLCLEREKLLKDQYLEQARTANKLREELASVRRQLDSSERQLDLTTRFIEDHIPYGDTGTPAAEVTEETVVVNPSARPTSPQESRPEANPVTPESEVLISPIRPTKSGFLRREAKIYSKRSNGESSPGLRAEVKATISLIDKLLPQRISRGFH